MADKDTPSKPAADKATSDDKATSTAAQTQASQAAAADQSPAASGDPAVHKLLADKQTAQSNLDTAKGPDNSEQVKVWEDEIARIDKELGDLGYKV